MKRLFSSFNIIPGPLVALAVLFSFGLPLGVAAQTEPAADTRTAEATNAWNELRERIQQKLKSSSDVEETVGEVLVDLEEFARAHEGSEEAVFAWFNRGDLAAKLGRHDIAEESLRRAAERATDPRMVQLVTMLQNQLQIRPGKVPPDFSATTLSGGQVSLDELLGQVVLLDFWATWCAPCIAELPNMQAVYEEHADRGFEIVSISIDEKKAPLTDFLDKRELPWTHVWDPAMPEDSRLAEKYGVAAIPFIVLVGRDGEIIDVNLRGAELEKAVAEAVEQSSGSTE